MKQSFYFSHDQNAHRDEKMAFLRAKHDWAGVGIYWAWVELMHESPDGKLKVSLIEGIALGLNTDITLLKQIYNSLITSGLFKEYDGFYWSERVLRNKVQREEVRHQKSLAGIRGMKKRWSSKQNDNGVITEHNKGKERKGKEKTTTTTTTPPAAHRFIKPTLEEVKAYCLARNNSVDADKWFNYYESNGWRVGRNGMKNWKAAIHTWEKSSFVSAAKKEEKREALGL